jgi:hypothetical protein
MPTIVLDETQHVVGHYRTSWRRILSADPNTLSSWTPIARSNDGSIRITKDYRSRVIPFIARKSSVLFFQPVGRALVIVVEECDERTACPRQERVARLGNPSVRSVANNVDLAMGARGFLQSRGGPVCRTVIDNDDLARSPRLCESAIECALDSILGVVAGDRNRQEWTVCAWLLHASP